MARIYFYISTSTYSTQQVDYKAGRSRIGGLGNVSRYVCVYACPYVHIGVRNTSADTNAVVSLLQYAVPYEEALRLVHSAWFLASPW